MRIIAFKTLRDFSDKHEDCEQQLRTWYREATKADWVHPIQIKKKYASASFIGDDRVVFNIKGNKYRLIVRFNYDYGFGYIRFIGTHFEYDKIDAATI